MRYADAGEGEENLNCYSLGFIPSCLGPLWLLFEREKSGVWPVRSCPSEMPERKKKETTGSEEI